MIPSIRKRKGEYIKSRYSGFEPETSDITTITLAN